MARITVEDCLVRENNRFALVMLATHRAKQLLSGAAPLIDTKGNKHIVGALREIAASKVRFMSPEDIIEEDRILEEARKRAAEVAEQEKLEAAKAAPQNGSGAHKEEVAPSVAKTAIIDDADGSVSAVKVKGAGDGDGDDESEEE